MLSQQVFGIKTNVTPIPIPVHCPVQFYLEAHCWRGLLSCGAPVGYLLAKICFCCLTRDELDALLSSFSREEGNVWEDKCQNVLGIVNM